MKTLVVNGKKFASRLLILSFVIVVSVMFSTVPALATEFEFGTQFGISHIIARNDEYSDTTSCTAYGFLDHSLKEDCATIQSH